MAGLVHQRKVFVVEAQAFQVGKYLFQPGGQQEVSPRRQLAREEFEAGGIVHAAVEVRHASW